MQPPRITGAHIAHFALVPLLVLLERFAYSGGRSVVVIFLIDVLEMDTTDSFSLYQSVSLFGVGAPIAGGILAAVFGPYAALIVGALVASSGLFGLWATPDAAPALLFVITLGHGIFKPALWTVAAVQLARPREHARNALFVGMYLVVNLAAMAGSTTASMFDAGVASTLLFALCGAVMAVVPLPVAVLWWLGRGQEWPEPTLTEGLPVAGLGLAAAVSAVPFVVLMGVSGTTTYAGWNALGVSSSTIGMLYMLNPVIVMLGSVLVLGAWGGAQLGGLRIPDLVFVGVALVAASIGAFALHPAAVGVLGSLGLGAGNVALALCEVVVLPVALSRIAGDSHWRLVPLWLSAWFVVSGLAGWAGDLGTGSLGAELMLPLTAFVTGLFGVLLIVGGLLARRALYPEVDEPLSP